MKQTISEARGETAPEARRRFVVETFEKYERQLTAYALRFFGGRQGDLHAARDVVQFTFLKLCQQEPRSLDGKLLPWLYTVCRNRSLDELSSRGRRSQFEDGEADGLDVKAADPATVMERDEFLRRLPQLFGCLAKNEREVLDLWSHGFEPLEIAQILERSSGSVRVALHRAIRKLRQHPEVLIWLERATGQCTEHCHVSNDSSFAENDHE